MTSTAAADSAHTRAQMMHEVVNYNDVTTLWCSININSVRQLYDLQWQISMMSDPAPSAGRRERAATRHELRLKLPVFHTTCSTSRVQTRAKKESNKKPNEKDFFFFFCCSLCVFDIRRICEIRPKLDSCLLQFARIPKTELAVWS